jgi:outer membrane protein TolC
MTKRLPFGPVVSILPAVTKYADSYANETAVSLTVPLLKGWGGEVNLDAVRSSEFSNRTARRSNYQVRVNTVINTVAAIYNIAELNDLAALYRQQVESMKQYAATSSIKKDTGLATPMDVYRAEIRLKDVEDSLAAALTSLLDAKERLKNILSLDPDKEIVVKAPREYPRITITLAEAIETALANRIEVEHARDMFEEAERRATVAGKNQLPQLDLQMNYRRYNGVDEFDEILGTEEEYWSVNLVGSTDFKRTAEKAAYQKSLIQVRNAKLDIETVNDQIVSEVKQQLKFQENAYERINIRKEQMKQARGKLELAKIKYKHGMADNFDVIEAEREILLSEVNMMSVRTESIVGLYRLRAAMGTLIER